MEARTLKIAFTDFWDGFDEKDNFFVKLLAPRYRLEWSDEPDYLFYSVFGSDHLRYDCIKIFYTGENQAPDFNLCDYALGFERLDFGDRYFRLPHGYLYERDWMAMERKHLQAAEEEAAGKRREGFCAFVCSNDKASGERSRFFDLLSEYKRVDSGGRFRNNVGGPVADKQAFLEGYRFSIAFENCAHPGYQTEKLVQAFAAGNIPIYWGDPTIARTFNAAAFVNCHDYPSWDEAVQAVRRIEEDPDLQRQMRLCPALADPEASRERVLERLNAFLDAIFAQDIEAARRFSRAYWGARYAQQARLREKAYRHSVRGLAERLYKKTLWKARRGSTRLWKLDRWGKRKG